jgi:hypothetical protein
LKIENSIRSSFNEERAWTELNEMMKKMNEGMEWILDEVHEEKKDWFCS